MCRDTGDNFEYFSEEKILLCHWESHAQKREEKLNHGKSKRGDMEKKQATWL